MIIDQIQRISGDACNLEKKKSGPLENRPYPVAFETLTDDDILRTELKHIP